MVKFPQAVCNICFPKCFLPPLVTFSFDLLTSKSNHFISVPTCT